MHEIASQLEQVLRAHGVSDAEIVELRQEGRVSCGAASSGSPVLEIDVDRGSTSDHVLLNGARVTAESPAAAWEPLHASAGAGDAPDIVMVAGSAATTDNPIAMVEGATGARIPTGDHQRSGAMPEHDAHNPAPAGGSALPAILVVCVLLAVVVFLLIR
jgi:hypothetical protein